MSDVFSIEGVLSLTVDPATQAAVRRIIPKAEIDALNRNLAKAMTNAFKEGARAGDKTFSTLEKDLAAFAASAKSRLSILKELGLPKDLLAGADEQFRKLIRLQDQLHSEFVDGFNDPKALRGLETTFAAIRTGLSKEIGIAQSLGRDLSRARLVGTEGAEKRATTAANTAAQAAAQRSLAITKASLQQRVALTRFALDTIGRLEKGLIRVVEGAARTATAAISKIWDSTIGTVKRSFSRREQVISGGLRNETRIFQQAAAVQQKAQQGLLGIGLRQAAFLGGGLGVIGALKSTFTIGADFAQGLRVLQAQLGLTDAQMKNVRKTSIDLGNDIKLPGVSALDASTAINLLAKQFATLGAGAVDAATAASRGVLQLEIATKASADEAARLVGSSVNVFGIAATEATKVADQISQAIAKSAGVSVTDFSQAFTQAATVFSQFVTPAEGATESLIDFNTAIAALAKGGLIGSDAGTSLRSFFVQANKGTDESNAALLQLTQRAGESGTAFFDLSGKARPFTTTLDILRKGLVGLTDEQRTNTLQTIFGSDAIRAASILTGQSTEEYQKLRDSIAASEGAATRFADAQSGGLRRAFDAIISSVQTLQIQLFDLADRFLGPIALKFADFFGNLISGSGGFEVLRKGLIGVAAGLAAVAAARVGVEVLGLLAKVLPLLLTPFGALALVAAAVGAAFAITQKDTEGLKDNLLGALDAIRKFGTTLAQKVVPPLLRLKDLALTAVKPLIERVRELGQTVVQFLSPAATVLKRFFDQIAFGVKLLLQGNFSVALSQFKNIGKEIGDAFSGLLSKIPFDKIGAALSTNLGRALSGAGVGAVAGGVLAGPLGAALGAAFGAAVGLAIPRIRAAIAGINVASLFSKFLDGVRLVGQKIAEFLFDRKTLLAAAGLVGAALAVGGQFVAGFISGVLAKLGDIADVGAIVLNTLFSLPSIVKSIAALVLIFRRQLIGLFTSSKIGQEAGKVAGKNIVEGAQQGIVANVKVLGSTLKTSLVKVGKAAASGLVTALSAGLAGSALGDASSNLERGLGLAGIAGSAFQAFTIGGGGAAGGALAAGTVGVGLLSAALSANAKKAAEARARMTEYKDAVRAAGDAAGGSAKAIQDVFKGNVLETSDSLAKALKESGINLTDFQKRLSDGTADSSLKGLRDRIDEMQTSIQRFGVIGDLNPAASQQRLLDAQRALKFLEQQIKAVGDAGQRAALDKSLFGQGGVAGLKAVITQVVEGAKKIRDAAAAKRELDRALTATRKAAAIAGAKQDMEDLGRAADVTRTKVLAALFPEKPSLPGAQAGAVQSVPIAVDEVQAALDKGLATAIGSADLTAAQEAFKSAVKPALDAALGETDPAAAVAGVFAEIKRAIAESPGSQEVKDQLLKSLGTLESGLPPITLQTQSVANLQSAAAAGDQVAAEALAAAGRTGPVSIKSKEDAVAAGATGERIFETADTIVRNLATKVPSVADTSAALVTGGTIYGTVNKEVRKNAIKPRVEADTEAATSAGRSIVTGLASGIRAATATVTKAITQVVNGITTTTQAVLEISSPSKVFYGIGQETMQGFIDGFRAMETEATSIASGLADAVVASFVTSAQKATSVSSNTFADLLDSVFNEADLNRAVVSAQNGITTAFNGLRETVTRNAESLLSATAKPAGERSALERLLVGDTFVSLSSQSALGVANREAIAGAAEAVQTFAVSLLRQGQSVSEVTQQIRDYRTQLLLLAGSLGLTVDGVNTLVTQLGLGDDKLNQFVTDAQRAQQLLQTILAPAAQQPVGTPATVSPVAQYFTNNFNTPFDDPEAVSLSVANRLARLVRT